MVYGRPAGIAGFTEAAGVQHVILLSLAAVVSASADRNPVARIRSRHPPFQATR